MMKLTIHMVFVTFLLLLLLPLIISAPSNFFAAAQSCYQPNATAIELPATGGSFGPCPPGYYCPGLSQNSSVVYICPPTDECLRKRLKEKAFCDLQGTHDVAICEGGYFCPTYSQRFACPSGFYCPVGSTSPRKCSPLSACPKGSQREVFYGSLLCLFVIIALFTLMMQAVIRNVGIVPQSWNEGDESTSDHHAPNVVGGEGGSSNAQTPKARDLAAVSSHSLQRAWGSGAFGQSCTSVAALSPSANFESDQAMRIIGEAIKRRRATAQEERRAGSKKKKIFRGKERLSIDFEDICVSVPVSAEEIQQKKDDDDEERPKEKDNKTAELEQEMTGTFASPARAVDNNEIKAEKDKKQQPREKNPTSYNEHGEKILLHPMSGTIESGKITAIMGGSGAGKTVMMTRLLGRTEPGWKTSGKVRTTTTFDEDLTITNTGAAAEEDDDNDNEGQQVDAAAGANFRRPGSAGGGGSTTVSSRPLADNEFRELVALVPQDDVLHYELTVHANVYFSSEARLPASWTREEKEAFRKAVLEGLQLLPYADRRVGAPGDQDESGRGGLSGGQRKRCSIAVELAAAPIFLACDEPTSSVDASVARKICELLSRLAREADIPVILVIHQPRVEIWEMIDNLLLLAPGGRQAYAGPREDVVDFLKDVALQGVDYEGEHGIKFDVGNPADTVVDVVTRYPQKIVDAWAEKGEEFRRSLVARKIRRAIAKASLTSIRVGDVGDEISDGEASENDRTNTVVFETTNLAAPGENEGESSSKDIEKMKKKKQRQHESNLDPTADVLIESGSDDEDEGDQKKANPSPRLYTTNIPPGKQHTEQAIEPMKVEILDVVKEKLQRDKAEEQNQQKQQGNNNINNTPVLDNSRVGILHESWLMFLRRILKFATDWKVLVNDVIMTVACTAIVSASVVDAQWGAPLQGQYVLLGAKFQNELPFMYGMLACIGVAAAVGPSAIRVWGLEKPQLLREFRSGSRVSAVYLGYSLAEMLRILLLSFVFATVAYLMWQPVMQFGSFFGIIFSFFLAQDAAAAWIGILVPVASARLIALIATVFLSLLNGFPDVPFIFFGFFSYWGTVLLAAAEWEPSQHVFDMAAITGDDAFPSYVNDPIAFRGLAIAMVILWFVVLKIGTFLHLVYISKK